jgi:iron complex outermembrane recepter protein
MLRSIGRSRRRVLFSTTSAVPLFVVAITLAAAGKSLAQDATSPTPPANISSPAAITPPPNASPPAATTQRPDATRHAVPEIVVNAPKTRKPAKPRQVAKPAPAPVPPPPQTSNQAAADGANISGHVTLQATPALGKTGTKLGDLPATVQIIPRAIAVEQGDTTLHQVITNASGVNSGGQDSLGYFDHFLIRGMNAQIYQDGFSDGDQLGGLTHSLNGVKQVEVLEGPGSSLFGSGPPGGTINIVHFQPSPDFHWGSSVTAGSWGTIINQDYVTGPTTIKGLNYRVDGYFSNSDGYRDLGSSDFEIRPDFLWTVNDHTFEFTVDARKTHQTPDSYGMIYFHGTPIASAPIDAKYSTPWAYANENYLRSTASDKWYVNNFLTVNNRFAFTYRTLNLERNGDSTGTTVNYATDMVTGRQLREQYDRDMAYDYQFEPVWTFMTGSVGHTLLTGLEAIHQTTYTQRQTADLSNIANVFAPVPPEANGVLPGPFQCNSSHNCDDDRLQATYLSAYATDQIDVTDRFKVRAGVRTEWWDTSLLPYVTVPSSNALPYGAYAYNGQPIIAGNEMDAKEKPTEWNFATLYKLFPGVTPYAGVSKSFLTNFNSETIQQGIGPAESALQYEGGVKWSFLDDRLIFNTAVFRINRENVATTYTIGSGATSMEAVTYDAQKTDGVEATMDAKMTDQWHILANATVMDAYVTSSPQNLTWWDHAPQGVPRYLANLWSTYDFSLFGIHGFQVGAGLNYQDKSYSDSTQINSIPAFTIANAELAYLSPTWDVILNVKNLTDHRYYIAANAAGAYVGEPLAAYLTVRYKD